MIFVARFIWVCLKMLCTPFTQWFCWSLSLLFMAISLGVYPIFRHTHFLGSQSAESAAESAHRPGHLHPKNLWHLEWGFWGQQKQLIMIPILLLFIVVNRYKHLVRTIWLVVWNMTGLFSISYMGCHPFHWRTPSFFMLTRLALARPSRTRPCFFRERWLAAEEEETIDT